MLLATFFEIAITLLMNSLFEILTLPAPGAQAMAFIFCGLALLVAVPQVRPAFSAASFV